jgi:hypothetical protein
MAKGTEAAIRLCIAIDRTMILRVMESPRLGP